MAPGRDDLERLTKYFDDLEIQLARADWKFECDALATNFDDEASAEGRFSVGYEVDDDEGDVLCFNEDRPDPRFDGASLVDVWQLLDALQALGYSIDTPQGWSTPHYDAADSCIVSRTFPGTFEFLGVGDGRVVVPEWVIVQLLRNQGFVLRAPAAELPLDDAALRVSGQTVRPKPAMEVSLAESLRWVDAHRVVRCHRARSIALDGDLLVAECEAAGVQEYDAVSGRLQRTVTPCADGPPAVPAAPVGALSVRSPDGIWEARAFLNLGQCGPDGRWCLAVNRCGRPAALDDRISLHGRPLCVAHHGSRILVGLACGEVHWFVHVSGPTTPESGA